MASFDVRAADEALKRRAVLLRTLGLEAAAEGYDIGHGPITWDGRDIGFEWRWFRPEEQTPEGWLRYSKNYWQ